MPTHLCIVIVRAGDCRITLGLKFSPQLYSGLNIWEQHGQVKGMVWFQDWT